MTKALSIVGALLLSAAALSFAMAGDDDDERGLIELVKLAGEYDAGYRATVEDFAANKEQANISRSALYPQASARAGRVFVSGGGAGDRPNASAEIVQTFSLRNVRSWQAATARVVAEEANNKAALQSLRARVLNGWLRVQFAADTLVLLSARQNTLQERQKRAEQLRLAGNGLESDVLSAKARVFDVEAQIARARNDLAAAREVLLELAGALPFVAGLHKNAVFAPPPPEGIWIEKVAAGSFRRISAKAVRAAAEESLNAAESAVYPELDVSAGASNDGDKLRSFSGRIGFSLRQPLFTGGRIGAEKRRLLAGLRAASARLAAVRREEERTTKERIGAIRADIATMRALTTATEAADSALGVVEMGHQLGARTITEVLAAEEDLFDSRLQLRRAQYDYLGNLIGLHELAGGIDDNFVAYVAGFFQNKAGKKE